MSSLIVIPLGIAAWIFTIVRFKAILSNNLRKAGAVELNIGAILLFLSITLTFMVEEFAEFFNARTFPNFSLLISHSSSLITAYFAAVTGLSGIEVPVSKRAILWIRILLFVVLSTLLFIYVLFVSKMPTSLFFTPRNPAEVTFKLITCSFGIVLSFIIAITHMVYLPSKNFSLMRFRGIVFIATAFSTALYLVVRSLIFASYFWAFLISPILVTLSYVFLVCSLLLSFLAFLSSKIYARFVIVSRSFESWHAFQDLKYLVEQLLLLCPVVALPTNNPPVWKFLSNPEYYLYRAIVIILDGRTMLADFLSESIITGEPPLWEDDMLREAVRVNQALQSITPSDEFLEIVDAYRRVSRDLFKNQNYIV
jgi:hypothetical protein